MKMPFVVSWFEKAFRAKITEVDIKYNGFTGIINSNLCSFLDSKIKIKVTKINDSYKFKLDDFPAESLDRIDPNKVINLHRKYLQGTKYISKSHQCYMAFYDENTIHCKHNTFIWFDPTFYDTLRNFEKDYKMIEQNLKNNYVTIQGIRVFNRTVVIIGKYYDN